LFAQMRQKVKNNEISDDESDDAHSLKGGNKRSKRVRDDQSDFL